ncbi:MAG: DnaJ domain-containing protein [Desulfobacterales bacterium]|nr:DnaJ domain-containing protein [Desulfobacterales bacterium]
MKDYYFILGLPRAASKERIKQAYREKAKAHHPDRCNTHENERKFMEAKEAYDTLSDDAKRAKYDQKLKKQGSGNTVSVYSSRRPPYCRRKPRRQPRPDIHGTPHAYKSQNIQERRLELILSPEEAYAGGRFPIAVPITRPCPHCRHGGLLEQLFCPACGGVGLIHSEKTVILELPPNITSGTTLQKLAHEDERTQVYIHATVLIENRI